jgi:hypothetical protein
MGHKFEVSLGYIERVCLNLKKEKEGEAEAVMPRLSSPG